MWEEDRKERIKEIVRDKSMNIDDSKIEEMSAWHQEMEVRMMKQIMRKTSDNSDLNYFNHELYVAEL
jgi:hypothetical protein